MMVEEDGDEVFVALQSVRCCVVGFENGVSVYSKLEPRVRDSVTWACCAKCGGSYGEWPKEGVYRNG